MNRYRVAVERTYHDVAVVWVEAEDAELAKMAALHEAADVPPQKDFGTASEKEVIECDIESEAP